VDLGGVGTLQGLGEMLKYTSEFISRLFHIYKVYSYMFWLSSQSMLHKDHTQLKYNTIVGKV